MAKIYYEIISDYNSLCHRRLFTAICTSIKSAPWQQEKKGMERYTVRILRLTSESKISPELEGGISSVIQTQE